MVVYWDGKVTCMVSITTSYMLNELQRMIFYTQLLRVVFVCQTSLLIRFAEELAKEKKLRPTSSLSCSLCFYSAAAAAAAAAVRVDAVIRQPLTEYCEDESFVATCPEGYAVLVTRAVYGRMRRGRCVVARLDVSCSTDVQAHLDWRCSGRPSCRLPVTDLLQGGTKPCPMDYRSYLEASYDCVPGNAVWQLTSINNINLD